MLIKKNGKIATTIHAEVNTIQKYIELHRKKGYKDSDIRRKLGKQCLTVIRINTKLNRGRDRDRDRDRNMDRDRDFDINNTLKNSAPCSECVKFLQNNNIHKIIYSLDDGTLHFSRVKDLDTTHLSRGQRAILRERNK